MVNKNKRRGSEWEREAVEELNNLIKGNFKRIPGSGSIGSLMHEGLLTGDIAGTVRGLSRKLKGEAKTGYGGATQLTVKKEWLDKIKMEAAQTFSIPFLIAKFSGARSGVKRFVVLDVETFAYLLNLISDLSGGEDG